MVFTQYYPGLTLDDVDHMCLLNIIKFAFGVMRQIEDEMLLNSPSMGGESAQRKWNEITRTRKLQIWNILFPATKHRAAIKEALAQRKRQQAKEFVEDMNQ